MTNAADIWAYGLVIWEMVALSPPHMSNFEDESSSEEDMKLDSTLDDSDYDITDSTACLKKILPRTNNKFGKQY